MRDEGNKFRRRKIFDNTGMECGGIGKSALALAAVAPTAEIYYDSGELDKEPTASTEGIYDGEGTVVERRVERSGMAVKHNKLQDRNDRLGCCQEEGFTR